MTLEKQVFLSSAKAKFILRKTSNLDRPAHIYFEVSFHGERSRLKIYKCKVLPSQWNEKRQRAYISPILSKLENANNSIVNKRIEDCLTRYSEFISYICGQPSNALRFHHSLKMFFMARTTIQHDQEERIDVLGIIEKSIESVSNQGTKTNYKKGLRALTAFFEWRNEPISNFYEINADIIDEFVEYLNSGRYKNLRTGKSYSMTTINSIIKYAVSAIKCVPVKYLSKTHAATIPIPQLTDKTSSENAIGLRDEEVLKLWRYKPTSKKDEEIRDMFLLLCLTGQRVGDGENIAKGLNYKDGIYTLTVVQDKCAHKLKDIVIIFPIAVEILKKYETLPVTNMKRKINENIGRIAKEAGIEGKEQISRHYQGNDKPTVCEDDRYNLIHSHTGRRTFVSILSVHGWKYEHIGKCTGQSIKMVEHYDKSTDYDRVRFQNSNPEDRLEIYGEIQPTTQQPTNNDIILASRKNNYGIEGIYEARSVLKFLGEPYEDNMSFDELVSLIEKRQQELYDDYNIDILVLKGLFKHHSMPKRIEALKAILKIFENKMGRLPL